MNGIVASIQVGRPRDYQGAGKADKGWTSAIDKSPISGPVIVRKSNLEGDEQADLVHHGGTDKAVLAYAESHYAKWHEEMSNVEFAPGAFGENLTIRGVDESKCCIGDIYSVGECLFQVSQPRQPCWKLSRRWNLPKLAVRVQQTGRTGWYLRVLREGVIEASMMLKLVERQFPQLTVSWANSVMYAKPRSPADDLLLAKCPALADSWKTTLLKRASRGPT